MKRFLTLVFACAGSLANAQVISSAAPARTTIKPAGLLSHRAAQKQQKVRHLSPYTISQDASGIDRLVEAASYFEMNRFAGYVLMYERAAYEKKAEAGRVFQDHEAVLRKSTYGKVIYVAVNRILQMDH